VSDKACRELKKVSDKHSVFYIYSRDCQQKKILSDTSDAALYAEEIVYLK